MFVCVSLRPRQTEPAVAAESSLQALISHMSLIMQRESERETERRAAGMCAGGINKRLTAVTDAVLR